MKQKFQLRTLSLERVSKNIFSVFAVPYSLFSVCLSHFILIEKKSISSSGAIGGTQAEDPGKAMAPHSSTLAWNILWTEEPGGLPSMGSYRVGHD